MARYINASVIAWSAAPGQDVASAVEQAVALAEQAAAFKSDLIVFPEMFLHAGLPMEKWVSAGPLPNAISDRFAALCRRHDTNMLLPIPVTDGGRTFNSSVALDRKGRIVGRYDKTYITLGEQDADIAPGRGPAALELDFGRVGQIICFDLNFPHMAEEMRALDVDLVAFHSMFAGGQLLNGWALTVGAYLLSAYQEDNRAIDMTGRELARLGLRYESCRMWTLAPILNIRLNLDRRLFHADYNIADFDGRNGGVHRLLAECPDKVTMDHDLSVGVVAIGAVEGASLKELAARYGLETRNAYFARATKGLVT